jgi:hypothetical protein
LPKGWCDSTVSNRRMHFAVSSLRGKLGGLYACGATFRYTVPLSKILLTRLFSKLRLKRKDFQEILRLPWAQEAPGSNPGAPTKLFKYLAERSISLSEPSIPELCQSVTVSGFEMCDCGGGFRKASKRSRQTTGVLMCQRTQHRAHVRSLGSAFGVDILRSQPKSEDWAQGGVNSLD